MVATEIVSTTNLEDLRDAFSRSPEAFDFVFFPDSGTVADPPTRSCLSQWGTAAFEHEGNRFVSSEQAFMHGKARLFGDEESASRILATKTSWMARELGSKVRGFDEATWKRHRFEIAVAANLPKFANNPALRDYLLSTGDSILVEASPTDRVWGNGLDEFDRHARDPRRWPGLNLLGFALMEVRSRIR